MVGWHHRLNRHEFAQAPGDGEEQGSLVCCSPWGRKESDTNDWENNDRRVVRNKAQKEITKHYNYQCFKTQLLLHNCYVTTTLSLSSAEPLFLHMHNMREKVTTRLISLQLEVEEGGFPMSLWMLDSALEAHLWVTHKPSSFSLDIFDNNGSWTQTRFQRNFSWKEKRKEIGWENKCWWPVLCSYSKNKEDSHRLGKQWGVRVMGLAHPSFHPTQSVPSPAESL